MSSSKKRCVISVYDKTGIVEFAKSLIDLGWEIVASGGTALILRQNGISCMSAGPEMLGGRVKTLHPGIHAGILARRDSESDMEDLEKYNIELIDMVVCNLYPFESEECTENIDIGGQTLIRSAAKNHKYVIIIVEVSDYDKIIRELQDSDSISESTKYRLATKAFIRIAKYDARVADYFENAEISNNPSLFPDVLTISYKKSKELRYGENPHQIGCLYTSLEKKNFFSSPSCQVLQGKALSFNNIYDTNAAIEIIREFPDIPTIVAVKHVNSCGVGSSRISLLEAFDKARACDPISIFGGIIVANQKIEAQVAARMVHLFLEIIIAPEFSEKALDVFTQKKNLRIIKYPELMTFSLETMDMKKIQGGILYQTSNPSLLSSYEYKIVTHRSPTEEEIRAMTYANKVVKHAKSNAIVLATENATVAISPGQTNRVWAVEQCLSRYVDKKLHDKVVALASDAFFPFRDCVDLCAKHGISCIIQPGGSLKDQDSIDVCNKEGITMVFTGTRHFKH